MKKNIIFSVDIFFYVVILFALVFLKDNTRAVNLIPFSFIKDYVVDKQPLGIANIVGNIVMFIPMGIFLSMKEKRFGKILLWIVVSSICIEVIQYAFIRGISDIDDVILNSVGGLIGIACYKISKLLGNKSDKIMLVLILCALFCFIVLYSCLHFGVFGFKIRIIWTINKSRFNICMAPLRWNFPFWNIEWSQLGTWCDVTALTNRYGGM